MVKSMTYNDIEIQYDDSMLDSFKVQKMMMDPAKQFEAMDLILCGKSDEVAEQLGGTMTAMAKLMERIFLIAGNSAKN